MQYLWSKPIMLFRLGEHPHGSAHNLFWGHRAFKAFIVKAAAVVGNKQVSVDPLMTEFNATEHFDVRVLGRACIEYVFEISQTGASVYAVAQFLEYAERNVSFAIVVHYLHDFIFHYIQFRNSVRENNSAALDLSWREALPGLRSFNKYIYAQMAVNVVYWGTCLREPLAQFWRNTRTLRLVDTHCGYDMFAEKYNLAISKHIESHITFDRIDEFGDEYSFTSTVDDNLSSLTGRKANTPYLKKVDADVALLKDWLRSCCGSNFASATVNRTANDLGLDLSLDLGGNVQRMRMHLPWVSMRRKEAADQSAYIVAELNKLCHWHHWAP